VSFFAQYVEMIGYIDMKERSTMDRREFLAGLCLCCFGGALKAAPFRVDEGTQIMNSCHAGMPEALRAHELVQAAWTGLSPDRVWDVHAHLLGDGKSGSGCWINPHMQSIFYPEQYLQRKFIVNGACVDDGASSLDEDYIARLAQLIAEFPAGAGMLLFAFDHTYREDGTVDAPRAAFHVPDRHAAEIAARFPQRFRWVASIHPYRPDALEALDKAVEGGAAAIKWLPSAMAIDPASARCDDFYAALANYDLPLITHAGQERAVKGAHQQQFGNPLRLRRPLDHGVRVVMAHCASMGRDRDLDRGRHGGEVESFSLFERMMGEARYEGRLFADISAMPQLNRAAHLEKIITRPEWHGRLLNGSDYPLPGVIPLFSVDALVEKGWLKKTEGGVLKQIREYNPLMFDFVLKRSLRVAGRRLSDSIFETGAFFAKT